MFERGPRHRSRPGLRELAWLVLTLSLAACTVTHRQTIHGNEYEIRKLPGEGGFNYDPQDAASLHPAVVEALLNHPELPFMEECDKGTAACACEHRDVARDLTPHMNELLRERATVGLRGIGARGFELHVSAAGRFVALIVPREVDQADESFVLDVSALPEAFDPRADLDAETVYERTELSGLGSLREVNR